jgi:hypothetical protein
LTCAKYRSTPAHRHEVIVLIDSRPLLAGRARSPVWRRSEKGARGERQPLLACYVPVEMRRRLQPNVPAEPPRLMIGPSAFAWMRWVRRVLLALTVSIVLLWLAFQFPSPQRDRPVDDALGASLGLLACAIYGVIKLRRVQENELYLGYTTLQGRWLEYWQLEPKTGAIIRRPGDPKAS